MTMQGRVTRSRLREEQGKSHDRRTPEGGESVMRAPSYEYVLLHQFEVVFRDGEHKTQRATRDYQKVWENVIDNPPEEGVTPVLVYRMNGETCAVVAGMDELIGNEECAMEILRLSAAATARDKEIEELKAMVPKAQSLDELVGALHRYRTEWASPVPDLDYRTKLRKKLFAVWDKSQPIPLPEKGSE